MPSAATPRGMIVTLCTGSAYATDDATSACPISWWATISRSLSDSTRLFFSSPATTRSMASSKSPISTAFFSFRAASSAASLTMLARSAPAKPGVRAAMTARSTTGASTTARAHPHEHLDELRARHREERHVGLAGHGPGQQGLAGPGRADDEHPLGDAAAQPLVLLGILEEIDDLDQLGLGLVDAGHVVEGRLQLLEVVDLVLAPPEGERLGGPAPDPTHEEHPDGDHDAERDDPAEQEVLPERGLDAAGELDLVGLQLGDQALLVDPGDARDREDADLPLGPQPLTEAIARLGRRRRQGARLGHAADFPLGQGDPLDAIPPQQLQELRVRDLDAPGSEQPGL